MDFDDIIDFADADSDKDIENRFMTAGDLDIPYDTSVPPEFRDYETESSDVTSNEGDEKDGDDSSGLQFAIFSKFPVQVTFIEKLDGTLEELITISQNVGSAELDRIWAAYLFQIIFALAVAQKEYDFTHNDLHINNVMYSNTDIKELIYHIHYQKSGKTVTYSIPTYGKIMKIIDFGRAIYTYDGKRFVSDAFEPDGDAGGQYNFAPYYNPEYRHVKPNPSFDLSRLSTTLIEYLFPVAPAFTESLTTSIAENNGPTISPVFNLLLEWITDKYGKNILRKPNGEERFPNFDIYKIIARRMTSGIPSQQFNKKLFDIFINNTASGVVGVTDFSLFL